MLQSVAVERIFPVDHLDRALNDLCSYVKQTKRNGRLLAQDLLVRQKLAELATLVEVSRGLGYQVICMLDRGKIPSYEASVLKVFLTEAEQRIAYDGLCIMGLYGQLEPGSKYAPLEGWLERWYLASARRSITAGTNEIQRKIIAQQGVGLPRT